MYDRDYWLGYVRERHVRVRYLHVCKTFSVRNFRY